MSAFAAHEASKGASVASAARPKLPFFLMALVLPGRDELRVRFDAAGKALGGNR